MGGHDSIILTSIADSPCPKWGQKRSRTCVFPEAGDSGLGTGKAPSTAKGAKDAENSTYECGVQEKAVSDRRGRLRPRRGEGDSSAPPGAGPSPTHFSHGLRSARLAAGFAPPAATFRRPCRGFGGVGDACTHAVLAPRRPLGTGKAPSTAKGAKDAENGTYECGMRNAEYEVDGKRGTGDWEGALNRKGRREKLTIAEYRLQSAECRRKPFRIGGAVFGPNGAKEIPPPLPGRVRRLRPSPTGCAPPALRRAALHPRLHAAAPAGAWEKRPSGLLTRPTAHARQA